MVLAMIDFDTDKEIVELTKTTLQEEVKKCRDDICSYFIE